MNSVRRSITESDGTWIVQQIRSGTPGKVYICPGCNQDLPASTQHTVAWRSGDEFGWGDRCGGASALAHLVFQRPQPSVNVPR